MNSDENTRATGGTSSASGPTAAIAGALQNQGQAVAQRATEAMHGIEKQYHAAAEKAGEAWDSTKAKTEEVLQSGKRYVQEHPAPSLLGVFSIGIVVGAAIGWAAAHQERDDYASYARDFFKRWGHKMNLD